MNNREMRLRAAPFSLRIVQRKQGRAALVYRRQADPQGRDRFQRLAAISPLAFTAATPLLRDAVSRSRLPGEEQVPVSEAVGLVPGPYLPLDADWGARVACFAFIAAGLRDAERLLRAANHLRHANPDEAAWWLAMLSRDDNLRALRALRILTESVQ